MKTHKIKHGGDFTINGIDDTFVTYCGITEEHSEDMADQFVLRYDKCTCQICERAYEKEINTSTVPLYTGKL